MDKTEVQTSLRDWVGEAEDPQRAIVRAFRATVARLVIFYLLTIAISEILVDYRPQAGIRVAPHFLPPTRKWNTP